MEPLEDVQGEGLPAQEQSSAATQFSAMGANSLPVLDTCATANLGCF